MHRFTESSFNCYCQLLRISINSITMDEHHVFVIKHQLLTEAITHKRDFWLRQEYTCMLCASLIWEQYVLCTFIRLTMLITQNN